MKKKLIWLFVVLFFLTVLGPLPVGYYYMRNKVLAHYTHGLIKADDNINVNWFRWWPVKRAQLALYLANPGGAIHFPPNYTETLAANLTLKSNVAMFCDGPCNFQQGAFIVTAPSGTNNFSWNCPFIHSATAAVNGGCQFQGYTGSGAAWSIGDSSGFAVNFYLRGITISLDTGPALANAQGLLLTNVVNSAVEYVWFTLPNLAGVVGLKTVGTGAFFAGIINLTGIECNASPGTASNAICIQGGAISNNVNIFGGHAALQASPSGSICIDVNGTASGGWLLAGFDCDVAQTAVTVESTQTSAVVGWIRMDSGVTNGANFGAGSLGNSITTNNNDPVVDSGAASTNSYINPAAMQWNSRRWGVVSEAGGSGFQIVDKSDSSQAIAKGVGGATHIDSSAGNPVRVDQNTGSGFEVWNNTAAVATISSTGFAVFNGGVNALGQADIVADSGALNTTETIIVKTPALVANRLVAGTHIRMTLTGTCTASAANTSTFTIRMGTLGTTGDTAIATPVTAVSAVTGTNIPFKAVFDFTIRTTGASGTGFITMELVNQGTTGISTLGDQLIMPTMSTFNTTTAANILSVSYKSAATTTTSTFKQGVIEIIQN